jgi:hypothetical protein
MNDSSLFGLTFISSAAAGTPAVMRVAEIPWYESQEWLGLMAGLTGIAAIGGVILLSIRIYNRYRSGVDERKIKEAELRKIKEG